MSDKITVDNIPDVSTLGGNAQSAGDNFRDETEAAYQTFQLKTEGQNGAALESFLQELNMLSTQVFHVFPGVLTNFGSTVENYASSLEGEGFSTVVYTESGDISSVKTWLTTQRSNSVTEKGEALDKAIADVKDVLSKDPAPKDIGDINSSSVVETAVDDLTDHSTKYQNTHDNLIDAKTTFVQGLDTVSTDLETAKGYLARANNLQYADPNYLIKWLADGKLTKSNMEAIYVITDKGDTKMLDVLMYEGSGGESFYRRLGKVDTTHVSQGMMDMAYGRFYSNLYDDKNNADIAKLNAFFGSLSEQDQEKVKTYMAKLSTSGVRAAAVMTGGAVAMLPEFGDTEAEHQAYEQKMADPEMRGQLKKINEDLINMGNLNALFESVYVGEIGKRFDEEAHTFYTSKMTKLELDDQGGFSWTKKTYSDSGKESGKPEVFNASYTNSGVEAHGDKAASEITDLRKQQQESVEELLKSGVVIVGDSIAPGLGTVLGAVTDIVGNVEEDAGLSAYVGSGNDLGESVFGEKYPDLLGKAAGGAEAVFGFVESQSDIDKQIEEQNEEIGNSLFDTGGVSVNNKGENEGDDKWETTASYNMSFDLQSSLQRYDMEQNGLRTYIYTEYDQETLDKYDKQMDKDTAMTDDARDMLAGESNKSIGGKEGVTQEELWYGLDRLQKYSESYGFSEDNEFDRGDYLENNEKRFNNLVGN